MLAVDARRKRRRRRPDPRDPRTPPRRRRSVAVTVMTNLGFHRLMDERGIRVVTTDVGDRYVLEALRREQRRPRRRAVRPCDLLCVTMSPVTGSPPRSSSAARSTGTTLAEAVAVMPRYRAGEGERARRPPRGARSGAGGGGADQRRAGRKRPRARPRLGHRAADSACSRKPRSRGEGAKTSVVGSPPSSRGSSVSPRRCENVFAAESVPSSYAFSGVFASSETEKGA